MANRPFEALHRRAAFLAAAPTGVDGALTIEFEIARADGSADFTGFAGLGAVVREITWIFAWHM